MKKTDKKPAAKSGKKTVKKNIAKAAAVSANKETRRVSTDLSAMRLCELGSEFCAEGEIVLGMMIWIKGVEKEGVSPAYCSELGNYCARNGFHQTASQCYMRAYQETREPETIFRVGQSCIYTRRYDIAEKIFGVLCRGVPAASHYASYVERLKQDDSGLIVPEKTFVWQDDKIVDEMERVFNKTKDGGRFAKRDIVRLAEVGYLAAREMVPEYKEESTTVLPFERYYGLTVSEEALLGRGFWPLKGGKIDRKRPGMPNVKDMSAKKSYSKFSVGDCYETSGKNWVKAISIEDEATAVRRIGLLRVVTSPKGEIVLIRLEQKICQPTGCGFGGFIIDMPGMNRNKGLEGFIDTMSEAFDDCDVFDREMKMLIAGRYLKAKETLVGKRLPSAFKESSYALQSTVAQAYWHVSIDEDEGKFSGFDFSTYYSTGSAEADMFSRPELVDDHLEDANSAILYILDKYTDEEWKANFK